MFSDRQSDSSLSLTSVVIGFALGVAATLVYATYRKEEFEKVVDRTRELSDKSGEFLADATDTVKQKVNSLRGHGEDLAEQAGDAAHRAKGAVKGAAKAVRDRA
jgi:hypothetical protein